MQPYRSWNVNVVSQLNAFGFGADDRFLVSAPLTHGASTYVLPVLGAGGCLVFPEEIKPAALLETVERHGATTLFVPSALIYGLVAEQAERPRDTSSLRLLIYGAAPMRPERIREAQDAFGPVVATSYGQTEAPQIITYLTPEELVEQENLASVGRASVLTSVAIGDEDGRLLEPGAQGEVLVRGDLLMSGYWRMPEKTAETVVDGWLRTGDVGFLDERGFLYLKDRSRDVIISGGFNVYPSDVEAVLGRHPAVYDSAVVGIPHEKWGEEVNAAVQLRPGTSVNGDELMGFVKAELGSVKAPKAVHILDALPKNAVGKIPKNLVRDEILARRATRPDTEEVRT